MDIFSYMLGRKSGGGGEIALQDKTVTPSAATQTVTADEGFAGLASVEVAGDSNLDPQNISEGVTIFGVEGKAVEGGIRIENGAVWGENPGSSFIKWGAVYGERVSSYQFYGSEFRNVNTVSLPENLTTIGEYAFGECSHLLLDRLPDSVQTIGKHAFENCKKITLTSLPPNLTVLNENVFYGCSNMPVTELPKNLTTMGAKCLCNCPKLNITTIPASVTEMRTYALALCSSLTSITFEGTPTRIYSDVFSNCTNLTVINVPWAEGEVANAPWGATNATINYNYTGA